MLNTLVGYARCSTDTRDLTAQRQRLRQLGVEAQRIYLDHGLSGTTCARPGLDQALAAVRSGDTLVVTKRSRLARSVPDARAIGASLAARGIRLGSSLYCVGLVINWGWARRGGLTRGWGFRWVRDCP